MEPPPAPASPARRATCWSPRSTPSACPAKFDEAPKEAETERERPIKIWLARFDQTPIRCPGKLEAQTLFATIRGKILFFRERPLTPEESQAMRH